MRNVFKMNILKWIRRKFKASQEDFEILTKYLTTYRMREFEDEFANHLAATPSWVAGQEWFGNALVLHLKYSMAAYYFEERITDRGFRRPDTILIAKPKTNDNAIVIKYKLIDNNMTFGKPIRRAKEGLMNMDKLVYRAIRQYDYVKKILKMCMVFWGRSFAVDYEIFNVSKLEKFRDKSSG